MNNKKNMIFLLLSIMIVSLLLKSCVVSYSLLTPATVPVEAETFTVYSFVNNSDAPAFLEQAYRDQLIQILQGQTRLTYVNSGGDLVFEGKIVGYTVDIANIQANNNAFENTLNVRVKVKYTNPFDESKNFDMEFSQKDFYPATAVLSVIQEDVNERITREISQKIFDKAFGDW